MNSPLKDKIVQINAELGELIEASRLSLKGQRDFNVEMVRALAQPVTEMGSIISRAKESRQSQPEIEGQLDLYFNQIGELRDVLESVRVMLLARRASLEAGRGQLEAVSLWATALSRTR
jgi:hypothetical protein